MDEKNEIEILRARFERAEEAARLIRKQASESVQKVIEFSGDKALQEEIAKESAYFKASCDAMQLIAEALYGEM